MIARYLTIIVVFISFNSVISFPVKSKLPSHKVLDFLKKFGYIEDDTKSEALYTEEGIAETIKTVQKFGALSQTGIIDNATLKLMSSPRCGVPDIIRNKRYKRYVLGSYGWNKRTLTYFVANWVPNLGKDVVTKNLKSALNTWGEYGHLTFKEIDTPDADIIAAFASGYHGDRYPFDGTGNILAHAFFPHEEQGFGGDIHFDADEKWIDRRNGTDEDGMDFFTVALHELGHSLGLSHSPVRDSVMFPYYQEYDINTSLQLGYDDILAMYEMYIKRNINENSTVSKVEEKNDDEGEFEPTVDGYTTTSAALETSTRQDVSSDVTTEMFYTFSVENSTSATCDESVDVHKHHDPTHNVPSTNSPSLPNICDGHFHTIAVFREEIFIFKEQYVWRLKQFSQIEQDYPILIRQMFSDLPKNIKKIDAAYERSDGMIVFFTGNKFWVYDGKIFVEDSPKLITHYGLPSTIDEIDAVQVWAKNGKTYFYKENIFWRYDESKQQMDPGYPKHMERWRGVPHSLDAATTWQGITYFFKNGLYWKFDNDWVVVTETSPLPTAQIWLGCPEDDRTLLFIK